MHFATPMATNDVGLGQGYDINLSAPLPGEGSLSVFSWRFWKAVVNTAVLINSRNQQLTLHRYYRPLQCLKWAWPVDIIRP